MPGAGGESVSAERNEKDEADDEGLACGDDEEGSELVEVSLGVISFILAYLCGVGFFLVVDVSCSGHCIEKELPEKWRPVRRIVRIRQIENPVR